MKSLVHSFWDFIKTLFFAGFLAFFCIRGFVFEPYKIPSGSMMPTLLEGDFLFVSKFAYGNRLPMTDYFFWHKEPKRGDIAVFKKKSDTLPGSFLGFGPTLFIKRIVGVPGDTVEYRNKQLYVNGEVATLSNPQNYNYMSRRGRFIESKEFTENLTGLTHQTLLTPQVMGIDVPPTVVPAGQYVVVGDNRDNSRDSRFWNMGGWGFVPKADLMGRAEFIFWSWDNSFVPRWERLFNSLRAQKGA